MKLRIVHLYPDLLDLYGDRGNVMTLTQRLAWRGYESEVLRISVGDKWDLGQADIVFFGGGSDREQGILTEDLGHRREELRAALAEGLPLLAICGGYQLLGEYYRAPDGTVHTGLGFFDFHTVGGRERCVGNVRARLTQPLAEIVRRTYPGTMGDTIVGFENHGGRTFLGAGLTPLAQVESGTGNNGTDGGEGLWVGNTLGTYLHGPFLPKNPHIADFLLSRALERRGVAGLAPLVDTEELLAHENAGRL
jgi:CobQ-like glutamine amidotransferase family enzyme